METCLFFYEVQNRKIFIKTKNKKPKLLVPTPNNNKQNRPSMLWIHGCRYVTGFSSMILIFRARSLVEKYNTLVISPSYDISLPNSTIGVLFSSYL